MIQIPYYTSHSITDTKQHTFIPFQLVTNNEQNITDAVLADLGSYGQENKIRINVYQVCEKAAQLPYFDSAILQLKKSHKHIYDKLDVKYLTQKVVRKEQMTPEQVSNWLLESDIHIILSHVHQGILEPRYYDWTPRVIEEYFFRLHQHRGFPTGIQLKCPIFLQDKFKYLSACTDICLPTLKVPIPIDLESVSVQEKIRE